MVIRAWCELHVFRHQVKNVVNQHRVKQHELNQDKRCIALPNLPLRHQYLQLMHLLHLQLVLLRLRVQLVQVFHFLPALNFLLLPSCASYELMEFSIVRPQAIQLVLKSNNVNELSHICLLGKQPLHALTLMPLHTSAKANPLLINLGMDQRLCGAHLRHQQFQLHQVNQRSLLG